jgi:hypothetical protein
MPGSDEYFRHFAEAKAAWAQLYVAIQQLSAAVANVQRSPMMLLQPNVGAWPTQEQLRNMCTEAQQKTIPLQAEYNALPADVKQYAPQPQNAMQRGG